MAHSHHMHREHQVSHRRVGEILKGEPEGAKKHSKSHAFSRVTSKTAAQAHDASVAGKSAPKRYARGGHVKGHKGHQTNIAIVMPKGGAAPEGPGGPPMPMAGAPGLPPPGGAPGLPPGMPPPGMPMRARGGRTKNIDGESTKADIKKWGKRAEDNSYMRGGAASGVGREEKAANMKRKGK